jgi:putative ubiquitin-RnfH superfamily antitoxin RatB of RatAB toxin-antitoxin module
MAKNKTITAELIYVPAHQQAIHLKLVLAEGSLVADAIQHSGLLQTHPEIKDMPTGIFGSVVSLSHVVKSGDRIEIYRPLLIDPKEKRRQRARQTK